MSTFPPPPGLVLVVHVLELPPPTTTCHLARVAAVAAAEVARRELGPGPAVRVATGHGPEAWPLAVPLAELPRVGWWRAELAGVVCHDDTGQRYGVAKVRGRRVVLPPQPAPGSVATLVAYLDPLSSSPPAWAGWLPPHGAATLA